MFATLFASLFVQGILLGLAALALLAAAPRLQKRYGPQWLCRLWVTLAVLLLVPLHALVPQAPAAVSVDTTPLYSRTALSQEVTERPADGVPYMVAMEGGAPTGYIVPRAELQTGHRTVLERLAVGATRLNLLALAWNLGVLAVALYQFGGYAVWRIRVRRTAQPVDPGWRSALSQGGVPAHGRHAAGTQPHGGGHAASRTSDPHGHGSQWRRLHAGPRVDPHKTA